MPTPRKKWRITYQGFDDIDTFTSEAKTYEFVRDLTRSYATNPQGMAQHLTVWVDERRGQGWERFEDHDLAELAGVQKALSAVSRKYGGKHVW
jgi:hypothetical protein